MSIFDLFQLVATNLWFYGGVFILVLSLLVFVHEWGHYIVARMCGVKVEAFSIGFGKELLGWNDKNGTRWKISLIPLGGYVSLFGFSDPASTQRTETVTEGEVERPLTEEEKSVALYSKPVWQRALVVFAGPAINFLFAIILLFGLYAFYGQPVTPPIASAIVADSAADKAGFEPHDEIISINGERTKRFEDVRRIVMVALDTSLEVKVKRDGEEVILDTTPEKQEITDRFGFSHSRGMLGIISPNKGLSIKGIISVDGKAVETPEQIRATLLSGMDSKSVIEMKSGEGETTKYIIEPYAALNQDLTIPDSPKYSALVVSDSTDEFVIKHGVGDGIVAAVSETWDISASTLRALGQMFTGTRSATELGGLIRIGAIAGDMAQAGLLAIITFTALLSINLGLINLFPIPMLDGGHLVFYAVEAIKGKPVPERVQEYAFRVGFVILIGLMLFSNLNDLFQLFIKS